MDLQSRIGRRGRHCPGADPQIQTRDERSRQPLPGFGPLQGDYRGGRPERSHLHEQNLCGRGGLRPGRARNEDRPDRMQDHERRRPRAVRRNRRAEVRQGLPCLRLRFGQLLADRCGKRTGSHAALPQGFDRVLPAAGRHLEPELVLLGRKLRSGRQQEQHEDGQDRAAPGRHAVHAQLQVLENPGRLPDRRGQGAGVRERLRRFVHLQPRTQRDGRRFRHRRRDRLLLRSGQIQRRVDQPALVAEIHGEEYQHDLRSAARRAVAARSGRQRDHLHGHRQRERLAGPDAALLRATGGRHQHARLRGHRQRQQHGQSLRPRSRRQTGGDCRAGPVVRDCRHERDRNEPRHHFGGRPVPPPGHLVMDHDRRAERQRRLYLHGPGHGFQTG